jgi:hypothetical protein
VTWVARKGQNAMLVAPEDVLAWRGALDVMHARARRSAR